jgi:BirA family biotin operon repressor/biotin-[acetyl-CoA-carboxylase] ligase
VSGEYLIMEKAGLSGARLLVFESLPSTNEWALAHAASCRDGDVVWARRQTAGRGRLGRSWAAPDIRGLTVSVLLRRPIPEGGEANMGQVAALAVRETLAHYVIEGLLKWPNDLLVGSRKIAGVLAEKSTAVPALVVGVGLNVNVSRQDLRAADLEATATSMAMEQGRSFVIEDVLQTFLTHMTAVLDRAQREGTARVLEAWAEHDALTGQQIEIRGADGCRRGRYGGLGPDGRLRLIDGAGTVHLFWTGDVVHVAG